jgi:stalled ribosome rescue protein Dom34
MKTTVGLWIDHKKAVIVFVTGRDEEIKIIDSNVLKEHKRSSDSFPSEDAQQRKMTGRLNEYYDKVISSLWNSGAILLMGPGEAKLELKKRIERKNLNCRAIDVETVVKLTDRQIVAKAREHSRKQSSERTVGSI